MFGQPPSKAPATGFSFGTTSATPAQKPAFSFGSSTTTNNNNNTTSTPAATGFSFNKPTNTTNKAATTPAFGALNTSTTTTTPSTGFSFGAKPATTTSFGTSTSSTTSAPAFGQPQQQQQQQPQQPQQPAANFNAQPSSSWSKPATSTATTTPAPLSAPTPFTTIPSTQPSNNVPTSKDYAPTMNDKLIKIKTSWDATNSQCSMVTHVYNKVDPSFTDFTRPANESPEEWENAMKNRPKDYNSIPVKCTGFTDLFERDKLQDNHVKQTRILLNEINTKLTKLNEKHDLHSNTLLLKCKMRQKNLNVKLLKIAINLSILKYKGYPLTNDEELLISRFNDLLAKLDDPIGLNRVNELWARLSSLRDRYSDLSTALVQTKTSTTMPSTLDDGTDTVKKLVKVLAKQQQGIQYLCELMEEDEATLARLSGQ